MCKIQVISFNYDRSLEYFLFRAIKYKFGIEDKQCVKKMNSIPIVHLYGQLDPLPWQESGGREYSSKKDYIERLRTAPQNLKLISDERNLPESEEFNKAYQYIEEAERIYFLGFGFDKTNVKRLKIEQGMQEKSVISTALGVERSLSNWIIKKFKEVAKTEIRLHEKDSLSLLEDTLIIE